MTHPFKYSRSRSECKKDESSVKTQCHPSHVHSACVAIWWMNPFKLSRWKNGLTNLLHFPGTGRDGGCAFLCIISFVSSESQCDVGLKLWNIMIYNNNDLAGGVQSIWPWWIIGGLYLAAETEKTCKWLNIFVLLPVKNLNAKEKISELSAGSDSNLAPVDAEIE